jgi:uncharacterized protein (UPF0276 family)
VAYAHIAGGADRAGLYHDTHTDPIPDDVLALLAAVTSRHRLPAVLLERDGHYPAADVLRTELDAIAAAAGHPVIT